MDKFELLLEMMRDKSNRASHDNEKSLEQAKALLKEQFSDVQKYKGLLLMFSMFFIAQEHLHLEELHRQGIFLFYGKLCNCCNKNFFHGNICVNAN
jgi:hypothetical protein